MRVNRREISASNQTSREADAEIDHALIERAQSGDADAFRQLVERHHRRAYAIAIALVRDEEDAREIVQEAFIRVYKGLSQFHGGSAFFTWLYRIVHNLSIDLIRKPSRREADLETVLESEQGVDSDFMRLPEGDPQDAIQRRQLQERIGAALDELPAYHRGVIVMREVHGMSYEEMAEAMGVSKGTIMSRLFHARKKLQKALEGCYEETFGAPAPVEDKP